MSEKDTGGWSSTRTRTARGTFGKTARGWPHAAAYCASHKTLAFGLPLLKTLFAANPDLAYF